ncbi:hypothetical protein B0J11DRAFT_549275 [Dendryphion nanum]|uniref:Molybdate-anion transporter n=1 Tax=Dendryphion nanum TaxID=256645 RepID=A0A9P9IRG8_9PLEO|nr:hypothetical protein B0J11DRAFT_549275 [Dendryphion nanum]
MDLYRCTFAGSLLLNSIILYRSYRGRAFASKGIEEKSEHRGRLDDENTLRSFKWRFFAIFLLVNGADWLQGPYIYPIYKDEKKLPEERVATLFLVGFLSGGISASFVGGLADRCGRRTACLAYCIVYSLSCLTLLSDNIFVLFFGRILGGMSGTMLYSVFESWMVAEFHAQLPDEPSSTLSDIFSTMTTSNSLVAIIAGIVAEWLVSKTGTAKTPFMASIGCLSLAFVLILQYWGENYGASKTSQPHTGSLLEEQTEPEITSKSALQTVLQDKKILVLALTSCFFEGSLFLFIFFKFPALALSHQLAGSKSELPFGLIFAILMGSMMLGSMLFNNMTAVSSVLPINRLLVVTLIVASLCFFVPAHVRDERVTLWCFCIFEVCCGVYYPLMAHLKGKLIDDGARASVYGILRVPLNAFVVLALSTTREGEHHRDLVFTTSSALLVVTALVVHRFL